MNYEAPQLETAPITKFLVDAKNNDPGALEELYEAVYPVLRKMAANRLGTSGGGTLTPTVVVNELFLKIAGSSVFDSADRQHFYTTCSRAMRFIVTDFVRSSQTGKRGGEAEHKPFKDTLLAQPDRAQEILDLDSALDDLETVDTRLRELVELKFFGGLNYREIGQLQRLSERTIKRDWVKARAFLVARSAQPAF